MPLLGGERQEVTSPALERIPAQEKTGIWNLIKSISSLLSTRPPPLPSGDPLEQLVRHFLIETGPKGVKIKGCPSEPYFGEAQGPRGSQEGGGRAGEGGDTCGHLRASVTSPCRQPVGPGVPALHLPAVPALLPAHPQQRWVLVICPPASPHPLQPKAASPGPGSQPAFPWDNRVLQLLGNVTPC